MRDSIMTGYLRSIQLASNLCNSFDAGGAPFRNSLVDPQLIAVHGLYLLDRLSCATLGMHVVDGLDVSVHDDWVPQLPDRQRPPIKERFDAVDIVLED